MSYIDSYTAIWSGICVGLMLGNLFNAMMPMPRRWHLALAAIWLGAAFGVRPLIDWLTI